MTYLIIGELVTLALLLMRSEIEGRFPVSTVITGVVAIVLFWPLVLLIFVGSLLREET